MADPLRNPPSPSPLHTPDVDQDASGLFARLTEIDNREPCNQAKVQFLCNLNLNVKDLKPEESSVVKNKIRELLDGEDTGVDADSRVALEKQLQKLHASEALADAGDAEEMVHLDA